MTNYKLHPQLESDSIKICDLGLSELRLINDSQYPWFILVPRVADITEIYQLSLSQQQQLLVESSQLSQLLMQTFNGDKLNVAAIGNMVSQLHLHHVVRFKADISWPKPVWGQNPMLAYSQQQLKTLHSSLDLDQLLAL